ncbi:related to aminotransferase [Ramularia collo-cygni]|uniref:Related to aminotransferase n=1 Tax=Ramularia collo-cygni TaxID=112498 RepID=A0A2D3V6Z8_9PEZI|nr:related to aminotransferase [Ramularia collo-cygni]CZT23763.1 related to aminotransferase [Ramularia collo-cygni]
MANDADRRSFITLVRGSPNPFLLPAELIRAAANAVLSDPLVAHDGLLYGPDPGHEPCREAVAKWLTDSHRLDSHIGPERICITGGASQNLGNVLNVYSDPGYTRAIWIVVPAYMLVFRIFEDAGFHEKMRAVPEDEEGLDIEYLRREIRKSEDKAQAQGNNTPHFKPQRERAKVYKHLLYCVPSFSNPSSRTMSLRRRRELVQLAREFDMLIACDDVYDMLQWPAKSDERHAVVMETQLEATSAAHLPRLVDIDRHLDGGAERVDADGFGNVISNGTFSKIAGPGLRVGWSEGTRKLTYGLSQAGVQRSGGAPSQLTSTYVARMVSSGQVQDHIVNVLRPAYASRYRVLQQAIKSHLFPLGFTAPQSNRDVVGGYFVWLGLPARLKAKDLSVRCQEGENVMIAPGNIFQIPGDDVAKFDGNVRLCFSWEEEWKLTEGIRRVGVVAKKMLDGC